MGKTEITVMDIDHGIAKIALLISMTGGVTFHTVILTVAGGTIGIAFLSKRTVVQCPEQIVGFHAGELNLVNKLGVMAFQTNTALRLNARRIFNMALHTVIRLIQISVVRVMVEFSGKGRGY
jgi:hypothetical protein